MSILVVGSIALDTVTTPFGEIREGLGGSAVHFAVSASYFTQVRLVGVVGEDFPKEHIQFLQSRGIDIAGLKILPGKTFRWSGRYGYDLNNAETLKTELNLFESFRPEIPEGWRNEDFVFLANIDPELQMAVIRAIRRPKLLACDTMNFWIQGKKESLVKTIREVDLLTINEGEARLLTGESNLLKASKKIRETGPKIIAIKQGEYGALLFNDGNIFSAPGLPLEEIRDPTGAGDSFAGGMMGHLAKTADLTLPNLRRAVIFGSVMASFNVEAFSCDRLRTLTAGDIESRYKTFKELAHFDAS